jgi:two-component system LytT family response regulator
MRIYYPPIFFFRAHHSHLVNIHFIVKYHKGKGRHYRNEDKSLVPLATRRKTDFVNLFLQGNTTVIE